MTYQKPKNIVEDVASLYANIVESQTEKVEQLNEAPGVTVGPGGFNVGGKPVKSGPSTVFNRPSTTPTPKGVTVGPGGFNVAGKPIQSGLSPIFQRPGAPTTAPSSRPGAPSNTAPSSRPGAPSNTAPSSRPGAPTSTANNRPAQTVAAAGGAGGRVTVGKSYAATLGGQKGSVTYDAQGNKKFTPAGGTPTSAKPAPTTTSTTTPTAGTTPTTPVTPQRSFNPLMQRTFGYQTGNAPDQIAAASRAVPQATSDAAFKKSAQMVRNIKPSANLNMELDLFDVIKGHLLDEGYAETEDAAIAIMANMGEQWKQSIVEGESGRTAVGDGRTVGPIGGAIHALFSGNLPAGKVNIQTKQTGPNRPPAVPASKDDSGKLTDFGAGGGKAKLKTGMSVGQVERQGRMNKGDYSG
jgi:hypothetical protein